MTLDQLRYFAEAAKFQHVGKAARAAHISPSAVSGAIAALEAELGQPLFTREGKSIVLNAAGKTLREEARRILEQVSGLKKHVQGREGALQGNYRLGASHFLAARFLTRAWSTLQDQHPELDGEICSMPTIQVLSELAAGTLDAGLCFSPLQHPELHSTTLYRGNLVVVVRKNHPLLKLGSKDALKRLSELPAVIHKAQPGVDLCEDHPVFARYWITPKTRLLFDSDDCAIERVTASDSWTLVPDLVAEAYAPQISALKPPSDWTAPYSVAAVVRKGRESQGVQESLRSGLKKLFAQ